MTDNGDRWVVAIVGAVVGAMFYVAMTAASWFGEPIGVMAAAAIGAAAFWGIDRFTEDES